MIPALVCVAIPVLAQTAPQQPGSAQAAHAHEHPDHVDPAAEPQISVEDEVLGNMRALELGPITVADLDLPEPFLRRVADRIIQSSFEERARIVVPDPKPGEGGQHAVLAPPPVEPDAPPVWRRPRTIAAVALGVVLVVAGLVLSTRRRSRGA